MLDDSKEAVVSSHDISTSHQPSLRSISVEDEKKGDFEIKTDAIHTSDEESVGVFESEAIIITGADAAKYLLPMRDDGDPSLTFRGMLLATGLTGFQATMYQIYQVCILLCSASIVA